MAVHYSPLLLHKPPILLVYDLNAIATDTRQGECVPALPLMTVGSTMLQTFWGATDRLWLCLSL